MTIPYNTLIPSGAEQKKSLIDRNLKGKVAEKDQTQDRTKERCTIRLGIFGIVRFVETKVELSAVISKLTLIATIRFAWFLFGFENVRMCLNSLYFVHI